MTMIEALESSMEKKNKKHDGKERARWILKGDETVYKIFRWLQTSKDRVIMV